MESSATPTEEADELREVSHGTANMEPGTEKLDTPITDSEMAEEEEVAEELRWEELQAMKKPMLSAEDALKVWNLRLEQDKLSDHHFREWWRQRVPVLLAPAPSMDYLSPCAHLDEEQIKRDLFLPLEKFLCDCVTDDDEETVDYGQDEDSCVVDDATERVGKKCRDPEQVLKELYALNDPPAQCGKLFRMGEPTYSCRDCGHDPTCVLCVECFKISEHRFHRYKMSTSCGGGYCDCGDSEAWSDFVYCSTHVLGVQQRNSDPLSKLPPEILRRARHVFASVLGYAYEMLTTETLLTLPADLTYKDNLKEFDFPFAPVGGSGAAADDYVTVLYNDEVHTFDEVISTLPRAVECDRETAIGFATITDKEGRCLVKCSGYQVCFKIRRDTQRYSSLRGSRPLKVVIMHSYVLAHQTFALRLLTWMQTILDKSVAFRALFSKVMLEKSETSAKVSRLENFFRRDTALWKSARTHVHHLLVSGMLLEMESKRAFAESFTRCYGHLMKDFIDDDHDHSFSITSLSVQLFTVPTLAHHLIAKCDVLAILLRTFMSECEQKRNSAGKLEFQRNLNLQGFRRASYILYDLKYLISTTPVEAEIGSSSGGWENNLRKGFLHGVSLLSDILCWMQGMDQQVRQVKHHVEYELEWESAFNLQFKLAPVFSIIQNWCSTDRIVFIKTMRMLFKKLKEDSAASAPIKFQEVRIMEKTALCIDYPVSSKPVSIHQPLTRMLAALSLHMEKFHLDWDANEFAIPERPSPVEMMESSLRTTVLNAQVQAGMWRRNGYSLVDQVRVYHDPRCRRQMLDLDVVMLQLGAALLNPDEYLIHLINKFQLLAWADRNFNCSEDDSVRQITTLIEEFFSTLITIVSERYTPGVGQVTAEDSVRREIIQLLCEEPMSHSALNRALAEDVKRETGMEKVVESVATFKKPLLALDTVNSSVVTSSSSSGKGVYELKPEFFSEYNVFFYHYTKEEQSKSEESQRKRKIAANLPECNPPPVPPAFSKYFARIRNMMKCDTYLYLISITLERADNLKSRCFSENQVHRVLHLIGLSLHEEERWRQQVANVKDSKSSDESTLMIVEGDDNGDDDDDEPFDFTTRAIKYSLYPLLKQLVGSQRISSHRHLLDWVLDKWRCVSGISDKDEDGFSSLTTSPQWGLSSNEAAVCNNQAKVDPALEKKRLAAERRQKIMEQMAKAQRSFMKENATLFEEGGGGGGGGGESSMTEKCEDEHVVEMDEGMKKETTQSYKRAYVALGPKRSSPFVTESRFTCILCQEEDKLEAGDEDKALVMAAFVQKSTVLSCKRVNLADGRWSRKNTEDGEKIGVTCGAVDPSRSGVESSAAHTYVLHADLNCAPHISSCGHAIHFKCWETFFNDVIRSERQRSRMRQPHSFDTEKREFLCPLCRSLSNAVLPLFPQFHLLQSPSSHSVITRNLENDNDSGPMLHFSEWLGAINVAVKCKKILSRPQQESATESSSEIGVVLRYRSNLCVTEGEALPEQSGPSSSTADQQRSTKGDNVFNHDYYYTCPLEQVKQELRSQSAQETVADAFARIYTDTEGQELTFSPSVFAAMEIFSEAVSSVVGLKVAPPGNQDERIPTILWKSCAFTIHCIVRSCLDSGKKSILDRGTMSTRHNACLGAMIKFCGVTGCTFAEPKVIRSHCLRLLSTLLEVDATNMSILGTDAFGLLVALTFSLPSLFNAEQPAPLPSANVQDVHILRLVFIFHLAQIFLTTDRFSSNTCNDSDNYDSDCRPILDLLHSLRRTSSDKDSVLSAISVWEDVKSASLHFLRCAALFYHHLSDVTGPPNLEHDSDDEFLILTHYLSLPSSPQELLSDSSVVTDLLSKWCNHPDVLNLSTNRNTIVTYPTKLNRLVSLPHDYSELINSITDFTCPKCEDARVPAMCLVCGDILCSQSYCSQTTLGDGKLAGACTVHSETCGAGCGIFLRVRECKVVLLAGATKGCFVQAPYVDQYGETDAGLRRGNPLHLCPDKYRKLFKMWLNHNIPAEIAHNLESNQYLITTPWNQL